VTTEHTDDDTRNPAKVMELAKSRDVDDWPIWHPGDGSQYRVCLVTIVGGPSHTDRVLLVSIGGQTVAVQYTNAHDPGNQYRFEQWTHAKWKKLRFNDPKGYDWWPRVIQPLLAVEGVA